MKRICGHALHGQEPGFVLVVADCCGLNRVLYRYQLWFAMGLTLMELDVTNRVSFVALVRRFF